MGSVNRKISPVPVQDESTLGPEDRGVTSLSEIRAKYSGSISQHPNPFLSAVNSREVDFPSSGPLQRSPAEHLEIQNFTGGLREYARQIATMPELEQDDYEAGQRLAERFANRPPQPVQVAERPLMPTLAPYLAAAGFFIVAGTGAAVYLVQGGESQNWSVTGTARAAAAPDLKIDSALTGFVPKTVEAPLLPSGENRDTDEVSSNLETPQNWAQTIATFKALSAAKPPVPQFTGKAADANQMLKAVEGWRKPGN